VLCSFETFDALYAGRSKSLEETIEIIPRRSSARCAGLSFDHLPRAQTHGPNVTRS
jgi:hypothetical protein